MIIALLVFSPVLIWNWQHDWASFKFQFIRARCGSRHFGADRRRFSRTSTCAVGPILFPVALAGSVMLAWRGYRQQNPAFILISTCALVPFGYFLWKSFSLRIGDTWPMLIWPFAFAAAAINLVEIGKEPRSGWIFRTAEPWARAAIVLGVVLNIVIFYYYSVSNFAVAAKQDPVAKEAGYGEIAARAKAVADKVGANMDRDARLSDICGTALASEGQHSGGAGQRAQPLHRLQGFRKRGP